MNAGPLDVLASAFPQMHEETLALFADELRDSQIDLRDLVTVVRRWIREERWPPTLADLLDRIRDAREERLRVDRLALPAGDEPEPKPVPEWVREALEAFSMRPPGDAQDLPGSPDASGSPETKRSSATAASLTGSNGAPSE